MTNTIEIEQLIEKLADIGACTAQIAGGYPPIADRGCTMISSAKSATGIYSPFSDKVLNNYDAFVLTINSNTGNEIYQSNTIWKSQIDNLDDTSLTGRVIFAPYDNSHQIGIKINLTNNTFEIVSIPANTNVTLYGIKL